MMSSPNINRRSPMIIRRRLNPVAAQAKLDNSSATVREDATPEIGSAKKGKRGIASRIESKLRISSDYTEDFGDTVRSLFKFGPSDAKQLASVKIAQNDMSTRCAKAELKCSRQDEVVASLQTTVLGFENVTDDLTEKMKLQTSELREARANIERLDAEVKAARLAASQSNIISKQALAMGSAVELMKSGLESAHAASLTQLVDQLDEAKQDLAAAKIQQEEYQLSNAALETTCSDLRGKTEASQEAVANMKSSDAASQEQIMLLENDLAREQNASTAHQVRLAVAEAKNGDLSALAARQAEEIAVAKRATATAESTFVKATAAEDEMAKSHQTHQDKMAAALSESHAASEGRIKKMDHEMARLAHELEVAKQSVALKVAALVEHESRHTSHHCLLKEANERSAMLQQQLATAVEVAEEHVHEKCDAAMRRTDVLAADAETIASINTTLKAEMAEMSAKLISSIEEVTSMKKALATSSQMVGQSSGQIEGLKEATATAWRLRDLHKVSMAEMTEKLASTVEDNRSVKRALEGYIEKVETLNKAAANAERLHDVHKVSMAEMTERMAAQASTIEDNRSMKKSLEGYIEKIETLNKAAANAERLHDVQNTSMAEMTERMADQHSKQTAKFEAAASNFAKDKEMSKDVLAAAKKQYALIEVNLVSANAKYSACETLLASTESNLAERTEELKTAEAEATAASELAASNYDCLTNVLTSTQSNLAETESDLTQMIAEKDNAIHQRDRMNAKYESTQTLLDALTADHASLIADFNAKLAKFVAENVEKTELIETLLAELKVLRASDNLRALDVMRKLYLKECSKRKVLQNQIREINGNIRVMCRIRPDPDSDVKKEIIECPDSKTSQPIQVKAPYLGYLDQSCNYEFDHVFAAGKVPASQEDVFKASTEPIVTAVLDGYNVAIIAYGQTGTGKTHTMMGTPEDPGVTFRSINHLLETCKGNDSVEYTITVEQVEVYLDKLVDLLSGKPVSHQVCTIQGGKVVGLEQRIVNTTEEVFAVMEEGKANRKVASTAMNSESSRSHLVVFITVAGYDKVTCKTSTAKLTLVDLAGSERLDKVHDANNAVRLAETVSINKSLAALGLVFSSIHAGAKHVPFRNSKLTHILQEVMTIDTKVCIFMHVSSAVANLGETLSTIRFGGTISTIEQYGKGNPKAKVDKALKGGGGTGVGAVKAKWNASGSKA